MTDPRPSPLSDPARVRLFGWAMMALLGSFLLTNTLQFGAGWPSAVAVFRGEFTMQSVAQCLLYLLPLVLAWAWVSRVPHSLRSEADRVTRFNAWLVRSAFFAVLLVGLADAVISFWRVEEMLGLYFTEETAKALSRPQERAAMVHVPLMGLSFVLALMTRTLGFQWLALLIVIAELLIVITRFIFSYEQAFMGDLVRFWYAALFLFASAHTLLEEGHVRVDILYAGMNKRAQGTVNAVGAILLGMTLCWVILVLGLGGKQAVIFSPLANVEVSQSGFGMYTKYLMAGFLAVFAITMQIQFVSQLFESVADHRGEPGGRELSSSAAH